MIVQTVSWEPYEAFIQEHVFEPLDMRGSFTSQNEAQRAGMATGYRYWFGYPKRHRRCRLFGGRRREAT